MIGYIISILVHIHIVYYTLLCLNTIIFITKLINTNGNITAINGYILPYKYISIQLIFNHTKNLKFSTSYIFFSSPTIFRYKLKMSRLLLVFIAIFIVMFNAYIFTIEIPPNEFYFVVVMFGFMYFFFIPYNSCRLICL